MSKWIPPASIEDLYRGVTSFGTLNRPTSGERCEAELPKGIASFQLYSLSTPNGQKVGILLEELGIQYDAHVTRIGPEHLKQFTSGFVRVNPNSKIPAAVDNDPTDGGEPIRLFESASILYYLAEKYGRFIPKTTRGRAECLNWLMWQMGGQVFQLKSKADFSHSDCQ